MRSSRLLHRLVWRRLSAPVGLTLPPPPHTTTTTTANPCALHTPTRGMGRMAFASTLPCLARRMRGSVRRPQREAAPGDWLCQCGETNRRSKRECFKCGSPSPPLPPGVRRPTLPGEDPHDWACPCGQMNFRGSVVCHKCEQPKPAPPPVPGKEVTLWTCPTCKGINRSSRKFCFRCTTPSPYGAEVSVR